MRKLRFSDAVAAIECSPKSLRKTLQNPRLILPSPPRDGWAEFSPTQLALLAIIRRLVDFGFTVERASITACFIMAGALAAPDRTDGQPLTAEAFLNLLSREYLVCYTKPGESTPFCELRQSDTWPELSADLQRLAVLVVPIGAVAARCFARAPVIPEDDLTGSDDDLISALLQFQTEFTVEGSDIPFFVQPPVPGQRSKGDARADNPTATSKRRKR